MKRLALIAFLIPLSSFADDAYIVYGGAPKLMKNHPRVRMVSERVLMTIGKRRTRVESSFLFRNEGPSATVRMGFPDEGGNGEDLSKPVLKRFRSWVDGASVKTRFVPATQKSEAWHVKSVAFAAGQTRVVRDSYEVHFSEGATEGGGYLKERAYVMHTGASWKGPIGHAEVIVRFEPDVLPAHLQLYPTKFVGHGDPYRYSWWRTMPKNTVVWNSFTRPKLNGREIRFIRSNFEPSERDDVHLYFGFVKYEDSDVAKNTAKKKR